MILQKKNPKKLIKLAFSFIPTQSSFSVKNIGNYRITLGPVKTKRLDNCHDITSPFPSIRLVQPLFPISPRRFPSVKRCRARRTKWRGGGGGGGGGKRAETQRNERRRETKGRRWRVGGNGWKCRSRKLISTLLRQKWIGPFYHTRNTHHIGGCLLAKVSRRRDTWRNIAVAVGSTGCGRRRPPSLCTTGGRRDARFSRTTLFLLATVVVSSYKRLPFCHQHEIYVLA